MIRAHKIRLSPNNKQKGYFARACGVARFAYNWALAEWNRRYEAGERVSEAQLRRELNAVKKEAYPWMQEVTKCAVQLSIMDLGQAFANYFAGRAAHPVYKKKGKRDSFAISNDHFTVQGKKVKIPKLGWVKMTEELRYEGKVLGSVISRTADCWYIAINVELSAPNPVHTPNSESQAVGVDLGVKNLVTLSDGSVFTGRKPQKAHLARLRRLQQALSRKQGAKKGEKKSKNYLKSQRQLQKLYARMRNIRQDECHKLTTMLTQTYSIIGIEDLSVQGMLGEQTGTNRALHDMSFFEFRRQLEYKAQTIGSKVVVADRYYPSSKLCSSCGYMLDELSLSDRVWLCPQCGSNHDRDLNAAINLRNEAVRMLS